MNEKLSTDPYKGVRDFYPEDMAVLKDIFWTWRTISEMFGYEEYNASILEPAELYRSKTSEEIVNEQTYTFTDRGEREVTLRPEMTPTVARMIAGRKRDLAFPVRWFSIPNCFRYERPQRGRVREFWQWNADIFGVEGIEAEVEIISLAYEIMKAFGAKDGDFVIKVNNRDALRRLTEAAGLSGPDVDRYLSHLDKKSKMTQEEFDALSAKEFGKAISFDVDGPGEYLEELITILENKGIANVRFDETLVRGFTYYTGTVFEVFDTDPANPRSLFGGGRYDRLLENFGGEKVPAVGIAMGDVIIRDFLETHGLLPQYRSSTQVMVCVVEESARKAADDLATTLRRHGIRTAVYIGTKKIGDQIKVADKKKIPYIVAVGENEAREKVYALKELATGTETELDAAGIANHLLSR